MKKLLLLASHLTAAAVGFVLGIYALPILIAPPAPTGSEVAAQAGSARYVGAFRRDLKDSEALHRGKGLSPSARRASSLQANWHRGRTTSFISRPSSWRRKRTSSG